MIDIKLIRDDPDRIRQELKARGSDIKLEQLLQFDADRRGLQAKVDELKGTQKQANQGIAKATGGEKAAKVREMKQIADKVKELELEHQRIEQEFYILYLSLPNFHHESVPVGRDEKANQVEREVGTVKKPTFKPKEHQDIASVKPHIDFVRGAKVAGSRFWYLKGPLVDLEFAILRYALDFYQQKGYVAMRTPGIVRQFAMEGSGFLPADAHEIYELANPTGDDEVENPGQLFLTGTAEVPLAAYHAEERLKPDELPRRYLGFSPAYRREAGSYGQDTTGIFRGHEFDKLELFVFAHPDKSWELHDELLGHAEEFWQSLGIPYRVVTMCTGDLAAPNAKKEDIEAWLPGQGKYREVASNSHDTDFQARRLRIHHGQDRADGLVHTLNNTACAVGRTIIAIVENYQDKDGNVDMPKVLHPYLPKGMTKIVKED